MWGCRMARAEAMIEELAKGMDEEPAVMRQTKGSISYKLLGLSLGWWWLHISHLSSGGSDEGGLSGKGIRWAILLWPAFAFVYHI